MIHASRRKILSLFAAAPAALPVAVTEAAQKAGIASVTAAAPPIDFGMSSDAAPTMNWDMHIKWLRDRLDNIDTPHRVYERRRRAEEQACRLNPNLASLRSVSAAAAYAIEVERQMAILAERDRISSNYSIADALKMKALST